MTGRPSHFRLSANYGDPFVVLNMLIDLLLYFNSAAGDDIRELTSSIINIYIYSYLKSCLTLIQLSTY
jgi:hypothetical protein